MIDFLAALKQAYKLVRSGFTAYDNSIQNPLHYPAQYSLSVLLAELKKYRPDVEHMFIDQSIVDADKQFLKGPVISK